MSQTGEERICARSGCDEEFTVQHLNHRFCSRECERIGNAAMERLGERRRRRERTMTPEEKAAQQPEYWRRCRNLACRTAFWTSNVLKRYCTEHCQRQAEQQRAREKRAEMAQEATIT